MCLLLSRFLACLDMKLNRMHAFRHVPAYVHRHSGLGVRLRTAAFSAAALRSLVTLFSAHVALNWEVCSMCVF